MRPDKFILLLILMLSSRIQASGSVIVFDSANAAYARGEFKNAIQQYEEILAGDLVSPELYYNLGNAYYKDGQLGKSILNYERARKLAPEDEDINTNLRFALQKTEDKIEAAPQLFLSEWKNGIVGLLQEREWSLLCIGLLIVSLILFGLFVVSDRRALRQTGFYSGAFLLLLSLITFFIAKNKYTLESTSDTAIILAPSVTVTGSPNEKGTRLFLLHEGTKVEILEEIPGWTEIRIANGNTGWMKTPEVEKI